MSAKKDFFSYHAAQAKVATLGIVTKEEYSARLKAGDLGDGMPSSPPYSYKGKGWESWGAFLGKKAKVAFIAYEQAHQHILSLNLPNRKAYWDLRASGELGEEYPSLPERTYEGQGWVDWGTFLGTGYVAAKNRQFLSFEDASQWCQKAKIKGAQDYFARFAKREMPDFLPQSPQESYAGKGWTTWGEFLGTGSVQPAKMVFLSHDEAARAAQNAGIKTALHYFEKSHNNQLPDGLPCDPISAYKNEGWKGWGNFLGTGNVAPSDRVFLTYDEASKKAYSLGILSGSQYDSFLASLSNKDRISTGLPAHPAEIYPQKWSGWGAFLKTHKLGNRSVIERILLHEIGCFLPVEKSSVNRIELGNGKLKNVDIISRELRLIVEYDGNVWHEKTIDKDKLETSLLEKQGWTVIRIREAPLLPLNPNLDLVIPSHGLTYHEKSCKVLSHLDFLGLIPKNQKNLLSTYMEEGSLLIPPEHMQSASLDEVKMWAKSKGLNTPTQWAAATAQADFPIRFPKSPRGFYGRRGDWKGWPDFFNRPAIQEPRKRKTA